MNGERGSIRSAGDAAGRGSDAGALLAARTAQALLLGAGIVTLLNTVLSPLPDVDVGALRVTGAVTLAASFLVPFLPWRRHCRVVSYGIVVTSITALVGTDSWHHFSRNDSSIAVYPVFFILVIAWAGLTQPRGTASIVALLSGIALVRMLATGGHGAAAWQCIAVTVPAAAMLGEVVSWAYGRALDLSRLDGDRRAALEALVAAASRLQGALTAEESRAIVVETADAMFAGRDTRLDGAEPTIDDGPAHDDARYDAATRELRILVRGQSGVLGTVTTTVDQPDGFLLDAARLYSQHLGTRLEQLRVIDALTDAANHDALTGVGNRRAAQATIETLAPGDAVFILDLDHFKAVNDSLGHQAGDEVLTTVGEYLRAFTRPADWVARYGGEEFLIVSRSCNDEAAAGVADRLLDGWRAQRPLVTFSIGYTIHAADDPPELTVEHADMALYEAKREGRDRARRYTHGARVVHEGHGR